ncbi:hypothetical protein M5K25_024137 [Dendrobium thyrsiflorum]|uniref:Uncharacterized protein n=1 Tax=Dendrobium thyrsiflorum TaxID=117978 RepID=A0ABD0U1D7_DENTH
MDQRLEEAASKRASSRREVVRKKSFGQVKVRAEALTDGFDAIGEHTGDDHDRNIMVSFGGKPPGSEGPGRNRLPTVPFGGKTIGVVPFDGETTG